MRKVVNRIDEPDQYGFILSNEEFIFACIKNVGLMCRAANVSKVLILIGDTSLVL